jgi:hypothetical protein
MKCWLGNLKTDHVKDVGADVRIRLKWILQILYEYMKWNEM